MYIKFKNKINTKITTKSSYLFENFLRKIFVSTKVFFHECIFDRVAHSRKHTLHTLALAEKVVFGAAHIFSPHSITYYRTLFGMALRFTLQMK